MSHTPTHRRWPHTDPRVVPLLPLVYVAWSDGVMTARELEVIREHLDRETDLPEGTAAALAPWLDPEAPPNPGELAVLREELRRLARRVPEGERESLARLGIAMSREVAGSAGGSWSDEGALRTLQGLEDVLGVLGRESARVLVAGESPPPPASTPGPDAAFDIHRLRRHLDGSRGELRARVMELLEEEEFRRPVGLTDAAHRERVFRALRRIADEGFGLLGLPEELGGGGDLPGSILVFEALGYGDPSVLVKFGVQFGLFGGSILQLGTDSHHERWLEAVGRLELPGCYAMTEVDHGSNVRDLETEARWDPESDGFRIRTPHPGARKDWIGNAALHGRMATVFARLLVDGEDHGVHAFLVPIRGEDGRPLEGVEIEDCGPKIGLHGVDNGRLAFRDVLVPRDHLLDRFGEVTEDGTYRSPISSPGRRFFTMLGTLVTGRISIAAASVSAAKTGLAIAVRYSADRRQFGPSGEPEMPVLGYLTQQRLLLPRLAATYGLHFAVRSLVERYGARSGPEDDPGVDVLAAGLKALASRNAQETLQACREACGGRGYLAENRIGGLRDDTDVFTTFEGANVVLLQLVARSLLSEYRDRMGELDLRGIVRLVSERAGAEVQRRNPVRSRRTGEEHLRDPETHRDAFRFREQRLLSSVARRLKHRIDEGIDSFQALNECQDHVVALARAHLEAEVLDAFLAGAEAAPDDDVRMVLQSLAALWALERLEADRAWFLEVGWMEPSQSRAVRTLVNRLCSELADQAVPLVDAFGIPEAVLAAPAARGGGRPGRSVDDPASRD